MGLRLLARDETQINRCALMYSVCCQCGHVLWEVYKRMGLLMELRRAGLWRVTDQQVCADVKCVLPVCTRTLEGTGGY